MNTQPEMLTRDTGSGACDGPRDALCVCAFVLEFWWLVPYQLSDGGTTWAGKSGSCQTGEAAWALIGRRRSPGARTLPCRNYGAAVAQR